MTKVIPMTIGIMGAKGSGKTTLRKLICASPYAYKPHNFADPIKMMLASIGLTTAELNGDMKENPNESILGGKTPREAMQTLGTDWGREMIDEDIWVNIWKMLIARHGPVTCIIADDVRFQSEADVILNRGGMLIEVQREGLTYTDKHISENNRLNTPRYMIYNDDYPASMENQFHAYVNAWGREHG